MNWSRILLATANQDKVTEMSSLLKDFDIHVLSINDLKKYPHVEEDQPTLKANAVKKAVEFKKSTGLPSLADDTGLLVDALDGAPGVYSARYAGPSATYDDNVDKLLEKLSGIPFEARCARFKTVMALAYDDNVETGGIKKVEAKVETKVETVEGVCEGYILDSRRGAGGFGYDPVFYVPGLEKTFAEMRLPEKNKISHRGLALKKIKAILQNKLGA